MAKTVPCVLQLTAELWIPNDHPPTSYSCPVRWDAERAVELPFVPRRGMRFSGLSAESVFSVDDADDEDDDRCGLVTDLVVWDLRRKAFVVKFLAYLVVDEDLSVEELARLHPGWSFVRGEPQTCEPLEG